MPAKIVQGRKAYFVWEAFVGFNVVFPAISGFIAFKRIAALSENGGTDNCQRFLLLATDNMELGTDSFRRTANRQR
jgi:hypothetical protein